MVAAWILSIVFGGIGVIFLLKFLLTGINRYEIMVLFVVSVFVAAFSIDAVVNGSWSALSSIFS